MSRISADSSPVVGDALGRNVRRIDACPICEGATIYCAKYDRFMCESCMVWTDKACGCARVDCPFPDPPTKPSVDDLKRAKEDSFNQEES